MYSFSFFQKLISYSPLFFGIEGGGLSDALLGPETTKENLSGPPKPEDLRRFAEDSAALARKMGPKYGSMLETQASLAEGIQDGQPLTPESRTEMERQRNMMKDHIASLPVGSPQRSVFESRASLFSYFLSAAQTGGAANTDVLEVAKGELGTDEASGAADKYLDNGNAKETPWCAAFVNWVVEQKGLKGTDSDAAKSFIEGAGLGHVGFKMGDKMIGGNQGDCVSEKPLPQQVVGWVMPEDIGNDAMTHKTGPRQAGFDTASIPDGAIIVTERSAGNTELR